MGGTANGTGDERSKERPDPQRVQTVPESRRALNLLRGTRSYSKLSQLARAAGGALAGSTVNNLLKGSSMPTKDTLVTFLAACGLDADGRQPWLTAWERVSTGHLRAPAGAVRVRQARPRLLGVHAAIRIGGADGADGELPLYVPRDLDADLRTRSQRQPRQAGSFCWWAARRWARHEPSWKRSAPSCPSGGSARADAGDGDAAVRLAELLADQGRTDEAIDLLRACVDAEDLDAAAPLAELLAKQGRTDEAIDVLPAAADADAGLAAVRLAGLLAEQGRVDDLWARADAGDRRAAGRLAGLLAKQGRVDELQARADVGDRYAAARLAGLLSKQGRIDEVIDVLRARADAGDGFAAVRLTTLLAKEGRTDELTGEVAAGRRALSMHCGGSSVSRTGCDRPRLGEAIQPWMHW